MSLLTMIQLAAVECNLSQPTTVIGNTDQNVASLLAFAKREGKHLIERFLVQEVTAEATLSALADDDQGDIRTLCPGYVSMVPNSMWNRTTRRRYFGPVTNERWQEIQAIGIGSLDPLWRIRGDRLLVSPNPTASDTIAFEYFTNLWVEDSGGTAKADFTADTDLSRINENIIVMGLVWRWLKARGLDYAEEKRDYEIALKNFVLRNNSGELDLAGDGIGSRRGDYFALEAV